MVKRPLLSKAWVNSPTKKVVASLAITEGHLSNNFHLQPFPPILTHRRQGLLQKNMKIFKIIHSTVAPLPIALQFFPRDEKEAKSG
jgi:hypothetical protein